MSGQRRREYDGDEDEDEGGEPGPRWIMQVVALFDYEPEEHDELAFREADVIRVVRVQGDGWWQGFLVEDPRRPGVFPSNYVRVEYRKPPEKQPPREAAQRGRIPQQTQQQSPPRVRFATPLEEDDGADEEQEEVTPRVAQALSTKASSVLRLKQTLADAERNSRAAQEARRKAEEAQIRQRQQRRYSARRQYGAEEDEREAPREEEEDEEDGEEDEGFYTQEQWRQQQHRRQGDKYDEDDEEREEDYDGDEYNDRAYRHQQRRRSLDPIGNEDGGDEEEEAEEDQAQDEDTEEEGPEVYSSRLSSVQEERAASRIARRYRTHHQQQEQQRREDSRRRQASSVVTQSLRKHVQRSREAEERSQRQSIAALAIQRWLVMRVNSAKQKDESEENDREHHAATRIQTWMRRRVAYLRWLQQVEAEREEMLRRREEIRIEEQRQRLEREAEQAALERRRREADERRRQREEEEAEAERRRQRQEEESKPKPVDSHVKKEKKRVMKKEAVELVKALVTQQLSEKLRDQDSQMAELQRIVVRLQDVIRQQSEMIQSSTDQLLERERHPQQVPPSSKQRSLKAPTVLVSKPESAHTTLPRLTQPSPAVSGPSASSVSRPSGIKPPDQFERTTKLPLLTAPGNQPNGSGMKR